jgi:hypothetical protein
MSDVVNRGESPNDTNADTLYEAFGKVNAKFDETDDLKMVQDASEKETPVDADTVGIIDSTGTEGSKLKWLSWSNIKATLKTYFDTLYAAALGADDNYVTDAEKVVIGNTSGTNTGDQTLPTRDSLGLDTDDTPTFAGALLSGLTASEIVATDASKNLQSLAVATYPSLAEIAYLKGVTSALQTQLDALQPKTVSINSQTGTTYTLVLGDAGKYIRLNNASDITVTVPPNSSVAFDVGTVITGIQIGAGVVTLDEGSGVTLNALDDGLSTAGQYAAIQLIKVATDTWDVIGGVA